MTTGLRHIATDPCNLSTKCFGMDKKRSPLPRNKIKSLTGNNSDSEASVDSNSMSGESTAAVENAPSRTHLQVHTAAAAAVAAVAASSQSKKKARRGSEWEILEGLKEGQCYESRPESFNGYLHKKRKWPLKGWHKRYFVLEKGLLVYAKNPGDVARGKLHGSVDIGLSVISTKEKRCRIDIDAEEFIYHLKAKSSEAFYLWVEVLKQHRLYRQHVLTFGHEGPVVKRSLRTTTIGVPILKTPSPPSDERENNNKTFTGDSSTQKTPVDGKPSSGSPPRLSPWTVESSSHLEAIGKELVLTGQNLAQLYKILETIESIPHSADNESTLEGASPNVKKDRKKFGLRKKKSTKGSSVDLSGISPNKIYDPESASPLSNHSFSGLALSSNVVPSTLIGTPSVALSSSNTSLPNVASRPQSLASSSGEHHLLPTASVIAVTPTMENQLREDFVVLAKDIHECLKQSHQSLIKERDRIRGTLVGSPCDETAPGPASSTTSGQMVSNLRHTLNQALQQNMELRRRLARIHQHSDLTAFNINLNSGSGGTDGGGGSGGGGGAGGGGGGSDGEPLRQLHTSLSFSSSCVSASEFFDAEDFVLDRDEYSNRRGGRPSAIRTNSAHDHHGGSSSEAASLSSEEEEEDEELEDDGSISSENSELGTEYTTPALALNQTGNSGANITGRRTKLPAPRPQSEGLSLWNLLCKNIGKDLSQVSMPVALNEPLSLLQRMCEELEYSELLDKANGLDDPYERMVYVAAFAVSCYASAYFRAGSKPFNPLLGETFECIREDNGFRFVAEQVSHHPPVSACYAESSNFIFWQEARIKTKFWGKSMEFQPTGHCHVRLPKFNDNYTWNKVTTCVHNLFSGTRYVDQYGELRITNGDIQCKMIFVKASYWSAKRHELTGTITNEEGKIVRNLFGKWSEALYCGVAPSARLIWRPGTMPVDYEHYYGFTRFAIELNELDPEMSKYLPITDTRFRPDQRLLEEGDLDNAEDLKLKLEQNQRERRKRKEQEGTVHEPRWFSKITTNGEEHWIFNHKYWETRKSPGFINIPMEPLW